MSVVTRKKTDISQAFILFLVFPYRISQSLAIVPRIPFLRKVYKLFEKRGDVQIKAIWEDFIRFYQAPSVSPA